MNAMTGALLAGWLAARRRETGGRGAITVAGTAAALVALAVAQARLAAGLR